MPKIYCGIGSRATPLDTLRQMQDIGRGMARTGWLLRSGGADGADMAFEAGCDQGQGAKEIWLPWARFNGSQSLHWLYPDTPLCIKAMEIAESVHPAWHRCNDSVRRLHARNVLQILGGDFETPVQRVICWTPSGAIVGGTATAIKLAMQYDIEVINLAVAEAPKL